MISAGPRVGSRCPRTHHAAALQVNVPLGRLDSLWSRVERVGVASVSLRASVEVGSPRVRGANPAREDILGFAGYGRGVEPRAPGRTTRARVSPRGGWQAHLLSRANVRRHAVPVERLETRCCARSFLSQPQKLRAKSRVDPRRASQRLLPLRADIILWWHVDAVARPGRPFAMGFMDLFKKKDPKEMVRKWQSKLRSEMRGVDRQIRGEPSRVPKRLLEFDTATAPSSLTAS